MGIPPKDLIFGKEDKTIYIKVHRDKQGDVDWLICPEGAKFQDGDRTYTHVKVSGDEHTDACFLPDPKAMGDIKAAIIYDPKTGENCVVGDIQPLSECKTEWACSDGKGNIRTSADKDPNEGVPVWTDFPITPVEDLWDKAWQHRYFIHHSPSWEGGTSILDLQGGKEWEEVISWYQDGHPKVGARVPGSFDKFWKRYYILDLDTFTADLCDNREDFAYKCRPYIPHSTENVHKLGVLKW